MSISALSSNAWSPPYPPHADAAGASAIDWSSSQNTGSITQGASDLAQSGTGSTTNPFQQLAADIQALLVQAQSGSGATAAAGGTTTTGTTSTTGATTTGTTTTGTTTGTASTPAQQLAADVQTIISELQSGGSSGGTAATQTGTFSQANTTGATRPHHHHHHHDGGSGAPASSASTSASASTSSSSSTATSSTSSADAEVANVFAADIVQALQSYGGTSSSTASIGLTA